MQVAHGMIAADTDPLAGRRLIGFFPIHNTGTAISYIATSILGQMHRQGADVQLWVPTTDPAGCLPSVRVAIPRGIRWFAYRAVGAKGVGKITARRFARSLRPGDIAYIWPGADLEAYQQARDRGAVLVIERINCPCRYARALLDAEATAVGRNPDHCITDIDIANENAEIEAADYVFAPSPHVAAGLIAIGTPPGKILNASYGWDPTRIAPGSPDRTQSKYGLRVLFVGLLCMRKGVHRLLDAWKQSGVRGQLILAGRLTDNMAKWRADDLRRADVTLTGHVANVANLYRNADVFAFPSFEEGSPLVSYEALGAGLPSVLSPMGAGVIARDGLEAIVLQPDDVDGWADAFRRLDSNPDLRAEMSRRAIARAAEFTWERCSKTRMDRLREALTGEGSSVANKGKDLVLPENGTTVNSNMTPARTNP